MLGGNQQENLEESDKSLYDQWAEVPENSDRILWVNGLGRGVPFQSKRDSFFIIMGESVNYMCKTGMFYLECRKLRKIHLMIRIVFIVTYHDSSNVVGWLF